ncbi:hypothetical protein BSP10_013 [Bacillus phage BSP10]|uniref:Uncharacterized protein n=1 Tax=Bacillus phage phiNIT1 TaxID=207656 RepID=S6ATP8_9CAUD|nr:hypothetical protein N374_gp185 [Bacillus phage phiNIT1]YP_010581836.1 glycosyltransferase [Bacillus phage SPG24]AUO79416.1 hypothetical protein BSP10_013 [Bacillus phage BSP10]AYJ75348.1 hypothetical protein BSP21_013 [Bacillus phage BSP21]QRI44767.1 putative site-specific recombinase [Bacillus phage BSTP3]BAN59606.1 hypothetical protein [Bacillus phage phiNIT1]
MTNNKSQEPISAQDLNVYFNYLITQHVDNEKHAKQINRLSRRTTTLSDVAVVFNKLVDHQERKITQLMEIVRKQEKLLKKLGATADMFAEVDKEYEEELDMIRKMIEENQKGNAGVVPTESEKEEDED